MGSDQNKALPLNHGPTGATDSNSSSSGTTFSDLRSQQPGARSHLIIMGSFAILTFIVMFLLDQEKFKDMVGSVGTKNKSHLSWANLGMENRASRKANINGDDDIEEQVSRQSVLLDIIQENKDTNPNSVRGAQDNIKKGTGTNTAP